jgi:hypothetical protein
MRFLVADTFARSIARLEGRARRTVQCAAFGFQMNPCQPGLRLHRLVHAKDPGFWSLSVDRDLRIIVHRAGSEVVFCYADHHDKAYAWAEHRRLGRHPESGALSLVEVDEHTRQDTAPGTVCERPSREVRRSRDLVPPGARVPVVELQRRMRTRTRAAAPLPHRPRAWGEDSAGRPLAELLTLAHRLGRRALAPTPPRATGAAPGLAGAPARAKAPSSERAVPLHARVVALALLAAPWPLLASGLARRGAGGAAALLAPGVVGSVLLLATGLVAACSIVVALRRAARESERIRDVVRSGRFDVCCDDAAGRVDPALRPILRAQREAVEQLSGPFQDATAALARIARGDIPEPLAPSRGGEFDRQRCAINAIVGFVQLRAEDIRGIIASVDEGSRDGGGDRGSGREGT